MKNEKSILKYTYYLIYILLGLSKLMYLILWGIAPLVFSGMNVSAPSQQKFFLIKS